MSAAPATVWAVEVWAVAAYNQPDICPRVISLRSGQKRVTIS